MIFLGGMKRGEIAAIETENSAIKFNRASQNRIIRYFLVCSPVFERGQNIVSQLAQRARNGKGKVLIGVKPRHQTASFSRISRSISSA